MKLRVLVVAAAVAALVLAGSMAGCSASGQIGLGGGSGGLRSGVGITVPFGGSSPREVADDKDAPATTRQTVAREGAWSNSPIGRPDFFPIAVWTQDPALAPQYKEMGVNTFFGLWQGPTHEQLDTIKQHGMYVICGQNEVSLSRLGDKTIIGWMHGDEPDNRQARFDGGPVPLEDLMVDYRRMRRNDPTRPVLVNFGQGVANDVFPGRALRLEDYPAYTAAADILSYDVYPVANIKLPRPDGEEGIVFHPEGHDLLWYVAKGVNRLQYWSDYDKPVWNVIECTHIWNPAAKPTPHQVRAQVWMSIINGSRGITWFVHQFEPVRNPQMLLSDEPMKQAVSRVNHEVAGLASVINSPDIHNGSTVETENYDVPIDWVLKRHQGDTYVFAVAMRNSATRGLFHIRGIPQRATATIVGEGRSFDVNDGKFVDDFGPYDVRLYRITER